MKKLAAVLSVGVLAFAVPAIAAAATPTFEAVTFVTTPGANSDVDLDLIVSSDNAAPARVVIYVPQGYQLNTSTAPGTTVGTIDANAQAGSTALPLPEGRLVADNPATYASNPCAPGAHAAVWVAKIGNFAVPIYIDPTSGSETSLGAFKLVVCLLSPYVPESSGGAPSGIRLTEADLGFFSSPSNGITAVFANPTATAAYLWRVLVTPYSVGTGTPNTQGTYELRSAVPIPARLTMKKRSYSKKKKQFVVAGVFTALGKAFKGIRVDIYSLSTAGDVRRVASAKTNKKGAYSAKLKVARTTTLEAVVPGFLGACDPTPASPAPAGCVSEDDTEIFSTPLKAVVR